MGAAKKAFGIIIILAIVSIFISYIGKGTSLGFISEYIDSLLHSDSPSGYSLEAYDVYSSGCHIEGKVRNLTPIGVNNVAVKVEYLDKRMFVVDTKYIDIGHIGPSAEEDFDEKICAFRHNSIRATPLVR